MTPEAIDLRAASRAAMPELGDAPRELLRDCVTTWRARMVNEYSSAVVFEGLAAQLEPTFGADLAGACLGFAAEERRHGVLCGAVVEAAGGEARANALNHPAFPLHADAPPRAAALRNVIHVCCMSETVAVALIGAERLEMPEGSLRALLTRIWADEVGHARFGWRLLESVGAELTAHEPHLKAAQRTGSAPARTVASFCTTRSTASFGPACGAGSIAERALTPDAV